MVSVPSGNSLEYSEFSRKYKVFFKSNEILEQFYRLFGEDSAEEAVNGIRKMVDVYTKHEENGHLKITSIQGDKREKTATMYVETGSEKIMLPYSTRTIR